MWRWRWWSGDGGEGRPHLLVIEGDVEVLQVLEVGLPEGGGLLHLGEELGQGTICGKAKGWPAEKSGAS